MKKIFFLGILILAFSNKISAQLEAKMESKRLVDLFNKLEGTYQIQVLDSRDKTEIPLYIMDSIQSKRDNTNVIYFPLKNNVRVMVLPYSQINKKGFIPLERVVNISSKN